MRAITRPELDPSETQDSAARSRWLLLGGVAAAVFVADLLTKWWAMTALADSQVIEVVWTLRFRLVQNFGSAFSLAEGRGALISIAALVAVAVLLRAGRRTDNPWSLIAVGLIIGGALGNLADRAFRDGDGFMGGGVVDFIDLQWWPVFNVADVGVVVGAALLIVSTWQAEPTRRT